jgi:GWxTD domain-containing protein
MGSHDFLWYLAVLSCRSLGLACLTWLALRVWRVKSASVRHAVWTIVTAVMLLQVVATPALPSVSLRVLAPVPDAGPTPQFAPLPIPFPAPDSHGRHLAFTWRQAVIGSYAAVALAFLAQLTFGYVFARRLVRNSKPVDGLQARESERISVPMTIGQIAPTILLPIGWREWDSAKLRAVLAHEEAHVRRADWAIGAMARINCCVFWFHPLAWWLRGELDRLAEFACDDSALRQVGDRQQYAAALFEIARAMKSARGRLIGDAISMAKETNVEKRMVQILDDTRTIPPAFGRRGWVTLLVCSLPLVYFASTVELARAQRLTRSGVPLPDNPPLAPQVRTQAGPPDPLLAATRPPTASPYQKWLDEDVVYLISADERRAFLRLTTDYERQQFIEQFWLRRDPTPGTEENEFKEEHYRRIAFANDHFSAGIPGWKTDRGAIYMKYGPPDSLDTYGATPATYPYETWTYRYLEGIGTDVELEFVDPTMTGRYHLTRDPTEKERH